MLPTHVCTHGVSWQAGRQAGSETDETRQAASPPTEESVGAWHLVVRAHHSKTLFRCGKNHTPIIAYILHSVGSFWLAIAFPFPNPRAADKLQMAPATHIDPKHRKQTPPQRAFR